MGARMRVLAPLAVATLLALVHIHLQRSMSSQSVTLSESSALALAEGMTSETQRERIARGVQLQQQPPETKAIALAEGKISDEERHRIAQGVKLRDQTPDTAAEALAEGKVSDSERARIAQGGIGGVDHIAPETKAEALAEGDISDDEAQRIAAGGIGGTDTSPPDSPALALAEDKITEEERQSIARGGYGPGVEKARTPSDNKQAIVKAVVKTLKKKASEAGTTAQPAQEVGHVVNGKLLARGMHVLQQMEQNDKESHNLNPRLVQKDIAPLVRKILKTEPKPVVVPPAAKNALAKIAAAQEQVKERKAAMAAEQKVLHALSARREEMEEEARERDSKQKEEVRKALGMPRIEGRGGLDAMSDRRVPLQAALHPRSLGVAPPPQLAATQAAVRSAKHAQSLSSAASHAAQQGQWGVFIDHATGRPYYFDAASGRATWQYPTQALRAREYTPEEEAEKAQLRRDRLDADRRESTYGGFPAYGTRKYIDPKTGVTVSAWPLDVSRILPAPNLDSSARIQNQRNAQRAEEGANSYHGGAPGKLNALGVNVDGGSVVNLPMMTHTEEVNHKLEDMGVLVDHPPFTGYKAVPYPAFDRTQFDHEKGEPRGSFLDRYEVDDDDHRLTKAGVRVYTDFPHIEMWAPDNPPKQKYVDGMLDNMHALKEDTPFRDYIPDSLDATPLHLWLKSKIDEGKHKVFH